MKYVAIVSDGGTVNVKVISDDLYQRINSFVNPKNYPFTDFQALYNNRCEDEPDSVAEALWDELNKCASLITELIQVY